MVVATAACEVVLADCRIGDTTILFEEVVIALEACVLDAPATDVTGVDMTAPAELVDWEDAATLEPMTFAVVVAAGLLVVDDARESEGVEEGEETIPALACEPRVQTQRKKSALLTCA